MRRYLLILGLACLMGCATTTANRPAPIDAPHKDLTAKRQDHVECLALASQTAQGAGSWTSVPAARHAIYEQARDQAYANCLLSRGWAWQR
jgi:hypothetical protein